MSDGTPYVFPEEPVWLRLTNEDEHILSQLAVERALQDPTLGLAESAYLPRAHGISCRLSVSRRR